MIVINHSLFFLVHITSSSAVKGLTIKVGLGVDTGRLFTLLKRFMPQGLTIRYVILFFFLSGLRYNLKANKIFLLYSIACVWNALIE